MLMFIVGFTKRQKLAKCRYADKRLPRKCYANDMRWLLDPTAFGMRPEWGRREQHYLERCQEEWQRVRVWNVRYPQPMRVYTTSYDGGFVARTTGPAFMDDAGHAMIDLVGHGRWALIFIEPINSVEQAMDDATP